MGWRYRVTESVLSPESRAKREREGLLLEGGAGVVVSSPECAAELHALQGAVDHGFEFASVFHFAAFGQTAFGFFRTEPGGMAHGLIGSAHVLHLHQKCFDYEFLHAARLPEHALGMNVEVKVARLDGARRSCFFHGFTLGVLAV